MATSHLAPRAELMARIDVAAICATLEISVGGASRTDIHLFGYLASMVNSQSGSSPAAWGYPFVANGRGLPFAEALEYSLDNMVDTGELLDGQDGLILSHDFSLKFDIAAAGVTFFERVNLVRDVCNVAVFRPLPTIGRAIRNEPQLMRSASVESVRLIDNDELRKTLMSMMLQIRDHLPDDFAAASSAMLWLDQWEGKVVE